MTKVISAIVLLAMVAHLIRPFGIPLLRKRGDAWRLAVLAVGLIVLTALIRPDG